MIFPPYPPSLDVILDVRMLDVSQLTTLAVSRLHTFYVLSQNAASLSDTDLTNSVDPDIFAKTTNNMKAHLLP